MFSVVFLLGTMCVHLIYLPVTRRVYHCVFLIFMDFIWFEKYKQKKKFLSECYAVCFYVLY